MRYVGEEVNTTDDESKEQREASVKQQTNKVQRNVKELFNLLQFVVFSLCARTRKKNIVNKSAIIIPERNDG